MQQDRSTEHTNYDDSNSERGASKSICSPRPAHLIHFFTTSIKEPVLPSGGRVPSVPEVPTV